MIWPPVLDPSGTMARLQTSAAQIQTDDADVTEDLADGER
jgi:hypothetical protein